MEKEETKVEINRLVGDEADRFMPCIVYEIMSDESIESVYYIIVDQDNNEISIISIKEDGEPNITDALILASKVKDDPTYQDSTIITWSDNIVGVLEDLLGGENAS